MALTLKDRVLETCTSPGTGAVTLLGAVTGYQAFSTVGNGNTCYYTIADQSGANWECGIGTYATSGNTLTRTTILSSSNAGSTVNFATGTQNVFLTYPSEKAVYLDASGNVQPSLGTATFSSITDSGLTSGRVTYATTGGLLTDSANMTFDGTNFATSNSMRVTGSTTSYASGAGAEITYISGSTKGGIQVYDRTASAYRDVFLDGANNLFQINGSEKMRLTSTGLGIGTSSPAAALEISRTSANPTFNLTAVSNGSPVINMTPAGSGIGAIQVAGAFPLTFYTNSSEQMRIDSSGNVGIGTSSPSFPLQVQRSGDSRVAIVSTSGSNTAVTQYSTNNGSTYWYNFYNGSSFIFQDNGNERMRIDSSGNLGVGTTSPAALLDVWGSGKSILVGGTASNNIPAQLSTALYLSGAYDASNKRSYRMYVDGNGALNFDTTGSYAYANLPSSGTYANKMTLDTSGNLLVGQTSSGLQNSLSYALQTDGNFRISHTSGTASGSSYASFGYGAGTAIGSITQNGSTGVLYNLTSDYRLKNNPTALTGASEFIMALQPKTWDWWDGSGKGVGFIAHEFMEVAKYSGNGTKDEVDAEGKPKYQSIQPSSSEVMANLVALVQEQQVIIEQLKAKVGI